jgi:hypothetical protein
MYERVDVFIFRNLSMRTKEKIFLGLGKRRDPILP